MERKMGTLVDCRAPDTRVLGGQNDAQGIQCKQPLRNHSVPGHDCYTWGRGRRDVHNCDSTASPICGMRIHLHPGGRKRRIGPTASDDAWSLEKIIYVPHYKGMERMCQMENNSLSQLFGHLDTLVIKERMDFIVNSINQQNMLKNLGKNIKFSSVSSIIVERGIVELANSVCEALHESYNQQDSVYVYTFFYRDIEFSQISAEKLDIL